MFGFSFGCGTIPSHLILESVAIGLDFRAAASYVDALRIQLEQGLPQCTGNILAS